jgi:hypothetical protein
MSGKEVAHFEAGLKQAGSDQLRPGEWTIYPHYEFRERAGRKYLLARETVAQLRGRIHYRPLSLDYADLFVEFAGWPKKYKISKSNPDEERNEEAARAWATNYGVLGLDEPRFVLLEESSVFIEDYLGRPGPDVSIGRGMLNEGLGGPEETVARFTDEALEARAVFRLYNAAVARDAEAITQLMGKKREDLGYPSIQEIYGRDPHSARDWALRVVQQTVNRKIAGRCYPTLHGDPGSYQRGWAFDSLLGAMWLQMLFRLTGQTRVCLWCGKVLAFQDDAGEARPSGRKPRSDRAFCPNNGLCKSKWNYHHGDGKSNKHAKKKARDENKLRSD